ncbi:MAG: hypothetical protein DI537_13955 [Stutzerimonas stutzeri]|nr:MAG: hypothetical protein DI537_13955 [Stutzerimonas stutzeri]
MTYNALPSPAEPTALETPKMLVLSTAHITAWTARNFDLLTDDVPDIFFPKLSPHDDEELGWIIPIGPDIEWSHMVSEDLVAIRKVAEREGCSWIMLDRDGDTIEELPSYDW